MAKTYSMRFGSGDTRPYTGLAPTFLIFANNGTPVTPPSISESPASSGIYLFTWGTTTPIQFLADAATTSPGTIGRYVSGALDPADRIDEVGSTLVAIGTTNVALGITNVALGTTNVGFGTSNFAQGQTLFAIGTTNFALGTTSAALGTTGVALGNTILAVVLGISASISGIGSTASSFGNSSTDPVDLFGYLKRIQENLEGNQQYYKASGAYTILSRGSSVTLASKTIANSVSAVIRS